MEIWKTCLNFVSPPGETGNQQEGVKEGLFTSQISTHSVSKARGIGITTIRFQQRPYVQLFS